MFKIGLKSLWISIMFILIYYFVLEIQDQFTKAFFVLLTIIIFSVFFDLINKENSDENNNRHRF